MMNDKFLAVAIVLTLFGISMTVQSAEQLVSANVKSESDAHPSLSMSGDTQQARTSDAARSTVRIQSKLSALWGVVMANMITADVLAIYQTRNSKMDEFAKEEKIKQMMLYAAIAMEIPMSMIFLSQVLRAKANRAVNVGAALATAAFIWGGASSDPSYIFLASMETVCLGAIVTYAFKWLSDDKKARSRGAQSHYFSFGRRSVSYTYTF